MAHSANRGSSDVRLTARVVGLVQGVGFRYSTARRAQLLGLSGTATNQSDGSVEVIAEGPRVAAEQLLAWLRTGDTPGVVEEVEAGFSPARRSFSAFRAR